MSACMNFIHRHSYPLLTAWILLSLPAAYNASFRPALPVTLSEVSDYPVLADTSLRADNEVAGFPRILSLNGQPVNRLYEIENVIDIMQIDGQVTFSLPGGRTAAYKLVSQYHALEAEESDR